LRDIAQYRLINHQNWAAARMIVCHLGHP